MRQVRKRAVARYAFIGLSVAISIPLFLFLVSITLSFSRLSGGFRAVTALYVVVLFGIVELIFIVSTAGLYKERMGTKDLVRRFFIVTSCQAFLVAISDLFRIFSLKLALGAEIIIWLPLDTFLVGSGVILGVLFAVWAFLQQKK